MAIKLRLFGIVFCLLAKGLNANSETYRCKLETYDASVKGNISSPFYGQRKYPPDLYCAYKIKAPAGQKIKITFKDFDVYPSKGCMYHRLTIEGEMERTSAFLCSNQLPRPILSDVGEDLYLTFETDLIGSGRGFLLEYESGPDLQLCNEDESVCGNRNCFKLEKKCDGEDDCGDGTDEEDCNHPVVAPLKCGKQTIKPKTIHDRLFGGEEAVHNSWPWQVSLNHAKGEPSGHFCGGTLINNQWVLTAAHCVSRRYASGEVKILLGTHSLVNKTSYQQSRTSVKVIGYPDLTEEKIANYKIDLALIKMNAPVIFNAGVQPACLPDFEFKPPVHSYCYVTGWGMTFGSGGSEVLKQMLVQVRSDEECAGLYKKDTGFCVMRPNRGVCLGDSGGPVQCRIGDKWYVYGAAAATHADSHTLWDEIIRCPDGRAQAGYAGTYGKVSWIKQVVLKYS